MKKLFFACCLLLAALSFPLEAAKKPRTDRGIRYLDTHFPLYDSLQKKIFQFAELGYKEFRSVAMWTSFLESQGFSIEREAAGIPTAFVATYGSGKPVIGMMAEYDAIAGMSQDTVPYRKPLVPGASGQACGHNVLGTGSVAGAVALSKWLAESGHAGTVKLFGCPAEEGGGGKAYMMREGVFEGLDAMLDWHPDTRNTVNRTSGLANVQVLFTFHGQSSHASGAPEAGRSALDAVEAFNHMMNMMREHVPQTSRIHYVITDGGKAPNVVPDKASVKYYFRSPSRTIVKDILQRALSAAEGAAMGTGTTMQYELVSGNYERLPNDEMAGLVDRSLRQVGGIRLDERELEFAREVSRVSGSDASLIDKLSVVVPPSEEGYEAYVSSDVGNVTWAVPTGSFRYSCFVPGGVGHSWQQVASSGTTIGTKGALGAAKVLYLSAVELMTDSALLDRVRAEFLRRRGPDFVFEPMMGNRRPPFREAATLTTVLDPSAFQAGDTPFLEGGIPSLRKDIGLTEEGLTYYVGHSSILDQNNSGRCWYFATTNAVRGAMEFSVVYPYFWDMMEKANLFLCEVWDHRQEALDSRYNEKIFRRPTWDGGHFLEAAYLIRKYGAVPAAAMPETHSSQNSGELLRALRSLLRDYGLRMRETTEPDTVKEAALRQVYRLLCSTLGTPPKEIIHAGKSYTPQSFALDFMPSLEGYAILMNDPSRPYYRMYTVEGSRAAVDAPDWTFLNLPAEELEQIGIRSLAAGQKFYFTADTAADAAPDDGLYSRRLYPLESELGVNVHQQKREMFLSYGAVSTHAMAMCGVSVADDGTPLKWVSENSFGYTRTDSGLAAMDADWWRTYMFRMAVERRFLPESLLPYLDSTPERIPYWNLY